MVVVTAGIVSHIIPVDIGKKELRVRIVIKQDTLEQKHFYHSGTTWHFYDQYAYRLKSKPSVKQNKKKNEL